MQQLGIPVEEYHTYEILPEAIAVSQHHFPWIVHHGDLYNANWNEYKGFDLVMGGMVCKSLSRAGIGLLTNNGLLGTSGIVYELQKAIDTIKPKWFFAENVIPSNNEDLSKLDEIMGCKGLLINSNLFSPQDRERYYWTNIPISPLPESNKSMLGDILELNVDEKYYYKKSYNNLDMTKKVCASLDVKGKDILKRIYNPNFKCCTLTCINGGYQEKKVFDKGRPRKLTEIEYERLQGFPDNFTNVLINGKKICYTKRCSMMGNAWNLPTVKHILSGLKK